MSRRFLSLFCPDIAPERLARLVEWCDHYSPLVAADGNDGVILDITGCTHLFGGEDALLQDLQQRFHRISIQVQAAISDTWGMAWAFARYGKSATICTHNSASELELLPVEALRLPIETILDLKRFGLFTISSVRKLPRPSLIARFGPVLLRRLDQAFQNAPEPLIPWRPPAPYRVSRVAAEPVSTFSSVEYVLRDLLQEICKRLEKNCAGSRHMDFACYRVDGTIDRCEIRTSKPSRSIPHLIRLFSDRLTVLDAGFGFETFVLAVLDVEQLGFIQLNFSQTKLIDDELSFDALVDRFGMRLGFKKVNHIRICESLLPEHSIELCSVTLPVIENAEWPDYRIRPVWLIHPPRRIGISILVPGGSPVQLLLGSQKRRIVRSEGPERLTDEWWREKTVSRGTRDYYRVEDEQGDRFWIFCDSFENWFLHGYLP